MLLVCDLDGTLIGDDDGVIEFGRWFEEQRNRVRLAYNSGRYYESVVGQIVGSPLPTPDAIISNVGTDIRLCPSGAQLDEWPLSFRYWDASRVRSIAANFSHLELQPQKYQSEWKVSFYGDRLSEDFLDNFRRTLEEAHLRVMVVYSSDRDLDLLPEQAGKGNAVAFLAHHWQFSKHDVIVCGDSGNDLAMFQQGFRGVVVANSHEELKNLSDANVYHSPESFARGVLDGVNYWTDRHRESSNVAGRARVT
jgi:sucrose-6F-phosphate phosphohydrolase